MPASNKLTTRPAWLSLDQQEMAAFLAFASGVTGKPEDRLSELADVEIEKLFVAYRNAVPQ